MRRVSLGVVVAKHLSGWDSLQGSLASCCHLSKEVKLLRMSSVLFADYGSEACVVVGTLVVGVVPATDAALERGLFFEDHVGVVIVITNVFDLHLRLVVARDRDDPPVG
jgi:hypothetical protein